MSRPDLFNETPPTDEEVAALDARIDHQLDALSADIARLRAIEEAARDLIEGQYVVATGTITGPDPRPEDFRHYVPGAPLAALRAALGLTVEDER